MSDRDDTSVTHGSGNAFADMGLANPEDRLVKARLASRIYDVIEARGWTQKHAAQVLGVSQPDVSKVTRGQLREFSVSRLLGFLTKLDNRVTITLSSDELPTQEIVIAADGASVEAVEAEISR